MLNDPELQFGEYFLENFVLYHQVGSGGYGKVRVAYDTINKRYVALKFLSKTGFRYPEDFEKIANETYILNLVDHENICKHYQTIETSDWYVIVLEYIYGDDLIKLINENDYLDEDLAIVIFSQLVDALRYLHSQNIVHGDVKPENIMITRDRKVKIVDFGFASFSDPRHYKSTLCGTPFYDPPEIRAHKPYRAMPVDVYCLGLTFYLMMNGYDIFTNENGDKTSMAFYALSETNNLPFRKDTSLRISSLIRRMLSSNPNDRPSLMSIGKYSWITINKRLPRCRRITKQDTKIVEKMVRMGVCPKNIQARLRSHRRNENKLYNLIEKKLERDFEYEEIAMFFSESDYISHVRYISKRRRIVAPLSNEEPVAFYEQKPKAGNLGIIQRRFKGHEGLYFSLDSNRNNQGFSSNNVNGEGRLR